MFQYHPSLIILLMDMRIFEDVYGVSVILDVGHEGVVIRYRWDLQQQRRRGKDEEEV